MDLSKIKVLEELKEKTAEVRKKHNEMFDKKLNDFISETHTTFADYFEQKGFKVDKLQSNVIATLKTFTVILKRVTDESHNWNAQGVLILATNPVPKKEYTILVYEKKPEEFRTGLDKQIRDTVDETDRLLTQEQTSFDYFTEKIEKANNYKYILQIMSSDSKHPGTPDRKKAIEYDDFKSFLEKEFV